MSRYRRRRRKQSTAWFGWAVVGLFGCVLGLAIYSAPPEPEIRERPTNAELEGIVRALLPLFTLPSGHPLSVTIYPQTAGDKWCAERHNPILPDRSAYTQLNQITVCQVALNYPHDRLERIIRHEMVHAWIQEGGVKDEADHGTQFMKKALEVGAYPLDEF